MNEAKYPSKERVERDGVLVHAEGDDLVDDPDEAKRQGYKIDGDDAAFVRVAERVERDGVLVHAEGDIVPAELVVGRVKTVAVTDPVIPASVASVGTTVAEAAEHVVEATADASAKAAASKVRTTTAKK